MKTEILYEALINNNYSLFKKSLKEDLEKELLNNKFKNEDFKMINRYDRGNRFSKYIKNVISEAENDEEKEVDKEKVTESITEILRRIKETKRLLREANADTDDVEDKVEKAEDKIDGDEEDEVEENMKKAKKKIKEAEDELKDVEVDSDDEDVVESLTKVSKNLKRIRSLIEEVEDEIEGSTDDVKSFDNEIEGSTEDVKESRKRKVKEEDEDELDERVPIVRRRSTNEEDDEIEGSTEDVKECINTITSKLREAENKLAYIENTHANECLESCKSAYVKVKNVIHNINSLGNMNINESCAKDLIDEASILNKVISILENSNEDVDPDDEDEVKEACLNFKRSIQKALSLLEKCSSKKSVKEEDDDEDEDMNESYNTSLIKRMNRLI